MEQLQEAYKQNNVILFVGAGVSIGLGIPSWNQLIDKIEMKNGFISTPLFFVPNIKNATLITE